MTKDTVRALEVWLSAQPVGDELNEMLAPVSIMAAAVARPGSTEGIDNDQHL